MSFKTKTTMKKFLKISTCLFATALFFSCSDDGDGGGVAASIEGKWTPSKTVYKIGGATQTENYEDNEMGCDKDYVQFNADGSLKNAIFFKNADNVCTEDANTVATYTKSGSTLNINGGEYDGSYTIKKLNSTDLQVETTETIGGVSATVTVYFKSVD